MIASLPRLHAVTDDRVVAGGAVLAHAAAMARVAGPTLAVHLRTRALEGGAWLSLARALHDALAPHGAWLVLNGRADVGRAAGAQAVVSGTGGLSVPDLRRAAPALAIGRSVHDEAGARAEAHAGADFLVAGAVYDTPSHPARPGAGLALVRAAAAAGPPVVAIGGITPATTAAVLAAGAWGVAAVRALWDAPDPAAAAAAFTAVLPEPHGVGVVVNGETRTVPGGASLADLLANLGLDARAVVVEHNRRIVRRDALAATVLAPNDAIELVHFVGGG